MKLEGCVIEHRNILISTQGKVQIIARLKELKTYPPFGKILQVAFICVLLCTGAKLSWGTVTEITVGVSTGYPPYYYDQNGELAGVCVDMVNYVAQSLNMKIKYEQYPWKRMLYSAEKGDVDAIMPLFRTKERERFLYLDNLELVDEENSFFTWKDSRFRFDGSFENMQPYIIGVVTGYSYGEKFDSFQAFKKEETQNDKHLVKMFKHKRFDVGIGSKDVVMFHARNEDIADQIQFLKPSITKSPLYIGFSKAKGHEDLARKFSEALQRFKSQEEFQAILRKNGMTVY